MDVCIAFMSRQILTSDSGTTTIYPQDDDRARPQELGGSIFVDSNLNLMKAVKVGLRNSRFG